MSSVAIFLFGFVSAFVVSTILGVILGGVFYRRELADQEEFWRIESERRSR